jgi:hypothetical protein
MKPKLITLIILATISIARANLIDLTPGGFNYANIPPVVDNFFRDYGLGLHNIAGANIINNQPVWSPFTIFGDDHFDITMNAQGTGANVGWDLSTTPIHLRFILIEGQDLFAHLYAPVGKELFVGDGPITIDGNHSILGITFAGSNTIPDNGSTLALMASSLLGLFFYRRLASRFNITLRTSEGR